MPVTHGNQEEESALFQRVMKRNSTPVLMVDAAFCSREESTTVVNGVSLSCSLVESDDQTNKINSRVPPIPLDCPAS